MRGVPRTHCKPLALNGLRESGDTHHISPPSYGLCPQISHEASRRLGRAHAVVTAALRTAAMNSAP